MVSIEEHVEDSMRNIRKNHFEIYWRNKAILNKLIPELHEWLDYFIGKKGKNYDYTGINCIKHREQRHHIQGIRDAIIEFTKKYGEEFKEIIEEESRDHIMKDMEKIYFKEDYKRIGFWKQIRGF